MERQITVVQRDVELGFIMDAVMHPKKWCDCAGQDCITLCEIHEGDIKYTLCLGFDQLELKDCYPKPRLPYYFYIDVFVDEGDNEAEGADTFWYQDYGKSPNRGLTGLNVLKAIFEKYFL